MKTSLTIIPMCPRERFPSYKSLSRLVLCYKKDWAILLHLIYFYYLLPVTNYLITKLSVVANFSACREYLAENRLSFPSAPHWCNAPDPMHQVSASYSSLLPCHLLACCILPCHHLHFIRMFFKTCIRSGSPGSLRCPFGVQTSRVCPVAPLRPCFVCGC